MFDDVVDDFAETTGVQNVLGATTSTEDGVLYNLSGQRVCSPTKGLYIINGKKIFVR